MLGANPTLPISASPGAINAAEQGEQRMKGRLRERRPLGNRLRLERPRDRETSAQVAFVPRDQTGGCRVFEARYGDGEGRLT
jgi:hypothetical protein